jgi:hypothetical protein
MMSITFTESQAGIQWLLDADEPWTRYRTSVDLLDRPADDADVVQAREEMLAHEQVQGLMATAVSWPGYALKRHNDAKHPLYAFSTLADFGVRCDDPGMRPALDKVLARQADEGAFQTQVRLYKRFGGLDGEYWTWMACDAPTLTYTLLAMGMEDDSRVQQAVDHLLGQVQENGWRCSVAPELGSFHGPGRRNGPCPIANVYALKVLSLQPESMNSAAARRGTEVLLKQWAQAYEKKLYLFGTGTDFRKLKYPFVWYDILHVTEVLSRFSFVHDDPRFQEMVQTITQQADEDGCYTATSMYRAWKGWSFADKKRPSPWLTFLVMRIQKRISATR